MKKSIGSYVAAAALSLAVIALTSVQGAAEQNESQAPAAELSASDQLDRLADEATPMSVTAVPVALAAGGKADSPDPVALHGKTSTSHAADCEGTPAVMSSSADAH